MIVTIDGPSGVGKSTAARKLAERLGFRFLDTGAMYRALALFAHQQGVSWEDDTALSQLLSHFDLQMQPGGVILLGDRVVTDAIRTPDISQGASRVAVRPVVRERLAQLQRQLAQHGRIVCEGRDQGTVVFPQAQCKFFLTADLEVRVERRARELEQRGQNVDREQLRQEMAQRDERDSSRAVGALQRADDAILIDSSNLSCEEVLQQMETEVRRRLA
ncbi:MAG: (d)CMP kinase [Gemmataceae bacterium]